MKTKTKHTPGPLIVAGGIGATPARIYNQDMETVATVEGDWQTNEPFMRAQLFAAAPEMLEALEHGIEQLMAAYKVTTKLEMQDIENGAYLNEIIMRLNEVLKSARNKARGES